MYDHVEPLEQRDFEELGAPVAVEVVNETEPVSVKHNTLNHKTTNIAVLHDMSNETPVLQILGQTFTKQDFKNFRVILETVVLLLLLVYLLKLIFK